MGAPRIATEEKRLLQLGSPPLAGALQRRGTGRPHFDYLCKLHPVRRLAVRCDIEALALVLFGHAQAYDRSTILYEMNATTPDQMIVTPTAFACIHTCPAIV